MQLKAAQCKMLAHPQAAAPVSKPEQKRKTAGGIRLVQTTLFTTPVVTATVKTERGPPLETGSAVQTGWTPRESKRANYTHTEDLDRAGQTSKAGPR